jgi:GxxExxY protein
MPTASTDGRRFRGCPRISTDRTDQNEEYVWHPRLARLILVLIRAIRGNPWASVDLICRDITFAKEIGMTQQSRLVHEDLSEEIIGAAMTVLNELRPGLNEKLYENALVIELIERGLRVDQQQRFPVHYKGRFVGKLIPDLIVEGLVVVDPKVVECFCDSHVAQVLGYLAITDLRLGLLLNFKYAKLQWKRLVR